MTRTLVITVDRDNDLGQKTAIRGPVVGRKQVLTAALKLGIADPEESDTNAILGALHQHDNLDETNGENDEVEVAILTGDEKVGVRSDRAIAAQLEEVVTEFQPDQAILVTDGAEDESVLPIIQSQVRIDHVQKIIVKQSKGIEGTYYYIAKALEDPKWRAKMLVPLRSHHGDFRSWCNAARYTWRNCNRFSPSCVRFVYSLQRTWNRSNCWKNRPRDARKRRCCYVLLIAMDNYGIQCNICCSNGL